MSNLQKLENVQQVVRQLEPEFNTLAKIHNAVHFEREASFALQALKDNEFLARVAMADQDSLKRAIINVAAIGLSLSPVHKLAYLVPRKDKVCLDISYRGFVQLALEAKSIKWAQAEVVYAKDQFQLNGLGVEPLHKFEPFGDRGEMVGAYCVAKTHDGEFLTTVMSDLEIKSIAERSESYRSFRAGKAKTTPWETDRSEMIKKTVIRRAYKSWPMTDTRQRFDAAVDASSEIDPIDFSGAKALPAVELNILAEKQRTMLAELNRGEAAYVEYCKRIFGRKFEKIEDFTEAEATKSIAMLSGLIDQKIAKDLNENAG